MRSISKLVMAIAVTLLIASCGKGGGAGGTGEEIGMGKADAPVKFIEYASLSCPHCAEFNNDVMPAFKAKYIDTGVVYYELREITTPPHNFAAAGFLTARCAGKDKYYDVIDAIFAAQASIFQSQDLAGGLRAIALSSGLSEDKWKQCVGDEAANKALRARVEKYNKEANITGTPTFYMNGKKVEYRGDMDLPQLEAAVAAARAAK